MIMNGVTKNGTKIIAILAGVATIGSGSSAFAQSTTNSSNARVLPASEVSQFVSQYGIPVIVGQQAISEQLADVNPDSKRLGALSSLVNQSHATWRKVY